MATIAALSVVNLRAGIQALTPASSQKSATALRNPELADTPPPMATWRTPVCLTAGRSLSIDKLRPAVRQTGVRHVAIGGGVSANSGFRKAVADFCDEAGVRAWIPARKFTTDNAAMVAMAGYFKFKRKEFGDLGSAPFARVSI